VGHRKDEDLCSILKMAIRILSASNRLAPTFDPEEKRNQFAYWISRTLPEDPSQFYCIQDSWV
jgi:hypothetical protein